MLYYHMKMRKIQHALNTRLEFKRILIDIVRDTIYKEFNNFLFDLQDSTEESD